MRLSILQPPTAPPGQASTNHAPSNPTTPGPNSIAAVKVLRISITDRCNYRCLYCMPETGIDWLPKSDILSFDEIATVARAAIQHHGITRFKITGGEPTVRPNLPTLVSMLRNIPGLTDLSLTTNGQLLQTLASPLRDAGLDRLTVSIDSLKPDRFARITRTGNLDTVLKGLQAATDAGFSSIKVNCVTMKGINDDELSDFARLTLDHPYTVRFIEYMPLGESYFTALLPHANPSDATGDASQHTIQNAVQPDQGPAAGCDSQNRGNVFISETVARQQIESELGPLQPVNRETEPGVGPANVYRLSSAVGKVGFISAMSAPFCATCNRLRLTADGNLRSCLFEQGQVNIRQILRSNQSPSQVRSELAQAMSTCIRLKPTQHTNRGQTPMSQLGG